MMTKHFRLRTFMMLVFLISTPLLTNAQSIGFGADFYNRYIWRGYDFGDSFSIQPGLAFTAGDFELGTWGSYSISADGAGANEHDLYATYSFNLGSTTSLALTVTDYYFPTDSDWLNFDGDGEGAHWIELMGALTLPESFPVTLSAALMVHNDPDNSLYLEGALPFSIGDVDLGLTLGVVAGMSGFYGVESTSLVNMGLSASKDLQITEQFSLPLSAAYVMNPTTEKTYLVFGFSLSP